ncbi:hypothetical protein BH10PSE12_BH10PSE12_37710 [soil metagenome]
MERNNPNCDDLIDLGSASEATMGVGMITNEDDFLRQRFAGLTDE